MFLSLIHSNIYCFRGIPVLSFGKLTALNLNRQSKCIFSPSCEKGEQDFGLRECFITMARFGQWIQMKQETPQLLLFLGHVEGQFFRNVFLKWNNYFRYAGAMGSISLIHKATVSGESSGGQMQPLWLVMVKGNSALIFLASFTIRDYSEKIHKSSSIDYIMIVYAQ